MPASMYDDPLAQWRGDNADAIAQARSGQPAIGAQAHRVPTSFLNDNRGGAFVGPPDVRGGPSPESLKKKGASSGDKAHDWLAGALDWLKNGASNGWAPPKHVQKGAEDHLATFGSPSNEGGARMMPPPDRTGSSPANASPLGGQPDFSEFRGFGGKQDSVRSPVSRGGTTAGARSAVNGTGRGNGVTPSKPGKSTGKEPVTQAPRSSDPAMSSTAEDVTKDPAVQGLTQLLKKYTDGGRDQVDLSPLAALSDSWSHGGKLLSGYERPMSDADRSKLTAQLSENLAKRQSDIEWHKARMAQMGDTNQARRDVAGINAASRDYRTDHPPPPRPIAPKGPKQKTPEQLSKAAYSANSGRLKTAVMSDFAGPKEAISGATQEAHQFADKVAKQYVAGGAYPDYDTAYQQAIHDLPQYARRGHFAPKGMRYHGANKIQEPAQDGGGGAD